MATMPIQVQMKLRASTTIILTVAFTLMVLFCGRAQAQTYITQYRVQLNIDNSATWSITQVSGVNGTVDTWTGFQDKVIALVDAAAIQTNRQMGIDNNSLQLSTLITENNSKSTEYDFTWLNFSVTKNGQLVAGDVFDVNNFFDQLYGNGELQINYPANYTLQSVTPKPDQQELTTQTLEWVWTQFFVTEKPSIELETPKTIAANSSLLMSPFVLASVSAVAVVAAFVAAWSLVMNRRQKIKEAPVLPTLTLPESEEEKILRVLRSNGGSSFQSAITEQCRFSKAKTSQLLTALEKHGKVRRYKRGRDKIVNLIEQAKGAK